MKKLPETEVLQVKLRDPRTEQPTDNQEPPQNILDEIGGVEIPPSCEVADDF